MHQKNGDRATEKPLSGRVRGDLIAVIILGVELVNSKPTEQMLFRLGLAKTLVELCPESICIVSGGAKNGEESEASVMMKMLCGQGIDPRRIRIEPRAKNTFENIKFSKAMLEEEFGSCPPVIICTEGYHQRRARLIGEFFGLAMVKWDPPFICSNFQMGKRLRVVMRELAAFVKDYLFIKIW